MQPKNGEVVYEVEACWMALLENLVEISKRYNQRAIVWNQLEYSFQSSTKIMLSYSPFRKFHILYFQVPEWMQDLYTISDNIVGNTLIPVTLISWLSIFSPSINLLLQCQQLHKSMCTFKYGLFFLGQMAEWSVLTFTMYILSQKVKADAWISCMFESSSGKRKQ